MSTRIDRANSEIQRCIADILANKMNDPRIKTLIYVSEVSVTPDFKYCKVKLGIDNDDQSALDEIIGVINKSEGFIKRQLAQMVKMPQVPKLTFVIDKGTSASIRINQILKTLNIPKDDEGGANE